jgi:hypothetical protein
VKDGGCAIERQAEGWYCGEESEQKIKTFGAMRLLLCYLGIIAGPRPAENIELRVLEVVGLIKGLMRWLHINVGTDRASRSSPAVKLGRAKAQGKSWT